MKQRNFTLIVSLSLIFSSAPVTGQSIYRWTDAQGRVHFSNAPVSEATAVDDELPPAPSFGGMQDSLSSSDSSPSIATPSPDEETMEDSAEPAATSDEAVTDGESVTTEEAAAFGPGEPAREDGATESFP